MKQLSNAELDELVSAGLAVLEKYGISLVPYSPEDEATMMRAAEASDEIARRAAQ